jgi:exodeoxyribonuclease VII small subunit
MADGEAPDDLGYEAARDELVEVVRRLEAGGATLEESLALWERGEQLADVCQRWLDGARARLTAAGQPAPAADEAAADEGTAAEVALD